MKDIKKSLQFMLDIAADDSHGYSQYNRTGDPDYDCSSLVAAALIAGGFKVDRDSTTRDLYSQLKSEGFVECVKPWKAGDIHLSVGHHVVMSVDENTIVHASIDENGTIKGKTPGDQTGKEICTRSYYEHRSGWTYHLRYVGGEEKTETNKSALDIVNDSDNLNRTPVASVKCTASVLKVRSWAGRQHSLIKSVPRLFKGDVVQVCDVLVSDDSKGDKWYFIRIPTSSGYRYGFACAQYLKYIG